MNLSRIDLNLFVVFDTIYSEKNLTRAGEILCITQPAVSNSLSRLREIFDDQLFVRVGHKMVATPVAKNAIASVREALKQMRRSLALSDSFDPSTAQHTFHISMTDIVEAVYLPAVFRGIHSLAPNIVLQSQSTPRGESLRGLSAGVLDFAIDVAELKDPSLCSRKLFRDRYVGAVRKGHPLLDDEMSLDRYLSFHHIHISSRVKGSGLIDLSLGRLGLQRRIALRIPHYLSVPPVVAESDLAVALPYTLAKNFCDLQIFELPFEVPFLDGFLYWHKRSEQDDASRWVRDRICSLIVDERSASLTPQPLIT